MLQANGDRLWDSLMEMARIGATERGGNTRLALTDEDQRGRELFIRWCEEAGMQVRFDPIGNLFARRAGRDPQAAPIAIGSHLDTQPKGGRFDGVYGVLAGLEAIRSLNDARIVTERPLELVVWTNEEGARFAPAMLGSAVFIGALALDEALAICDGDGVSVRQALAQIGQAGELPLGRALHAYYEAHIEQGPVLEEEGLTIGVVTGGQGICWLDVDVTGAAAHAGTTPMKSRRDAMLGAGEMLTALERAMRDYPDGLFTIGQIAVAGASRNTIAGRLAFTVDLRHPDDQQLARMEQRVRATLSGVAEGRRLRVDIQRRWLSPATHFDTACVDSVRAAAAEAGYARREMISGAGHDAINMAKHCPTAMIFIPCAGGISHNESESIAPPDAAKGCDILLNALLRRVNWHPMD